MMIRVYWKGASHRFVGRRHGITPADLAAIEGPLKQAHQTVVEQCRTGKLGYAALPTHPEYPGQVKALVAKYQPHVSDLVVLGIGGSALGNIALHNALNPATYNLLSRRKRGGPRLFVLDNVDPQMVRDVLKFVGRKLHTTLFNVISKSGETAETAAQFLAVRALLQDKLGDRYPQHVVATTDPHKGTLHDIARADKLDTLPVPGDVGGRFSVLSPVGLFSAAMCNIDIDAVLRGAEAMRQVVEVMDLMQNPAAVLAAVKYLAYTKKGKSLHVMMPYSNRLYFLADWYRQLWAESLGKKTDRDGKEVFVGPTPIKALGTTDQHSQVQLYREGPNDKLIVFLEVMRFARDLRLPKDMFEDVPGLSYLRNARMGKLLQAEKKATEYALAQSHRPSLTIQFPEITPETVGQFIYLYEFTTSLMGELLNINAYDQPAVELGKQATFALMGRKGYEDRIKPMKRYLRIDRKYLA